VLILARKLDRLQEFVVAFSIALVLTMAIFVFVPAVGAFVYVDLSPEQYARLPATVYTPARTLEALRSGTLAFVPLDDLEGLVAFPSFHTAAGLLYAWALWPLRRLRWPAIILNCAMIATTPLGGAHYVTDVLGGAIITALALVVARRVGAPRPQVRLIRHTPNPAASIGRSSLLCRVFALVIRLRRRLCANIPKLSAIARLLRGRLPA
jgi:membrane-associated phospholipid phosphatase